MFFNYMTFKTFIFISRALVNVGISIRIFTVVLCLAMVAHGTASAADLERRQAKRIHDRLAGVPPSSTVLNDMEAAIMSGDAAGAAQMAMDNSAFYNVTLKNFAAPWTNEEQTLFVPLNDYTATVIGMVRDNVPFNELLSADLVYTGDPALGLPAYSMTNNNHYDQLEQQGVDLQASLVAVQQSAIAIRYYHAACKRNRGRHDLKGGSSSIFYRWHQPCHVPFHAVEPPLQRPRATQGYQPQPGPDSPGCIAQPRW